MSRAGRPESHPALQGFFAKRGQPLRLDDALKTVRWSQVDIRAPLPTGFEDVPDLPDRIRGALGHSLQRHRALDAPRWLQRIPHLGDIIFGDPVKIAGHSMTRPFALRTNLYARELNVQASLGGIAANYSEDLAICLVACLSGGIAIKNRARNLGHDSIMRVPVQASRIAITSGTGVEPKPFSSTARIKLDTSLIIRDANSLVFADSAVLPALIRRVEDICAWDGMNTNADRKPLFKLAEKFEIESHTTMVQPYRRYSMTSGPNSQTRAGMSGSLVVKGEMRPFARIFTLGEMFNIGGSTSAGHGRISVHAA